MGADSLCPGERREGGSISSSSRIASSSSRVASSRNALMLFLVVGGSRVGSGANENLPTVQPSIVRSVVRADTRVPPTIPCTTAPPAISSCARRFLLTTSKMPVRRSISSTVSTVAIDIWLRSPSMAVTGYQTLKEFQKAELVVTDPGAGAP